MAITTNVLGPNSAYINYVYNDNYSDIYDAIIAFVTEHGWSVIDSSVPLSKVLVSTTTQPKYVRLVLNEDKIYMPVYETWNSVTHVGTNLAFDSDNVAKNVTMDRTKGGSVYVFVTKDYLVLSSRVMGINNVSGDWIGVVGIKPINDRYPNVPEFGWTSADSIIGAALLLNDQRFTAASTSNTFAANNNATRGYQCLNVPRSIQSTVGKYAADSGRVGVSGIDNSITDRVLLSVYAANGYGHTSAIYARSGLAIMSTTTQGLYSLTQYERRLFDQLPSSNDPETGLPRCYTLIYKEMQTRWSARLHAIRGRLHGVKLLTPKTGVFGDIISIPCGADLLQDENGTPTEHLIIPRPIGASYASFAFPL